MPTGSSAHFWSMGTAKATVFPEPVLLPPMTSLPFKISCLVMAIAERDATSHGATSSVAKLTVSEANVLSLKTPLLFEGTRPPEPCVAASLTVGFIREIVVMGRDGMLCLDSSSSESSTCGDNLRFLLELTIPAVEVSCWQPKLKGE
ncbi:MAG: hypothetical protein LQ347_005042 [Umbilicaria vellea]|nr:MAG: hypothetical protein LQ347_005042 [Umbilicaria vellea]